MTFICLLRGINVGGKRPVKMEALRAVFESAGGQNVCTYIQSGNVVFKFAGKDLPANFEAQISQKIETAFGFSVPLLFISLENLEVVLAENPFLKNKDANKACLHVTFFKKMLSASSIETYQETGLPADSAFLSANCAYLYCPDGYHKFKGGNDYWEKVWGTQATTRNWKTLHRLVEMCSE